MRDLEISVTGALFYSGNSLDRMLLKMVDCCRLFLEFFGKYLFFDFTFFYSRNL